MIALLMASTFVTTPSIPDDKIDGTWVCIKAERDGEGSEDPVGSTLTFADGKITIHDKKKDTDEKGTYKLDDLKDPKHITLIPDDPDKAGAKEFLGIYEIKDGKLTLCIAGPGGERPDALATKTDSKRFLMVFEREKSSK